MKVVQIGKFYYPVEGGIEKVVYDISNELKDKLDMNVLVANDKFKQTSEMINGVKVKRAASFGTYFSMPVAPAFPLHLGKYHTDIIHVHLPFPLTVVSYLLNTPKSKTIVTWHSDIVKQKNILKLYKPFLMKFLNKVDKIVVTSPNLIESSPFLKPFKGKCTVIPLGVDVERFTLTDDIEVKVENIKNKYDKPIIFFVGRLVYYKGVKYLVEAMRDIDAQLLVGGTGPLSDELKALSKKYDLEDKIEFLGFVDDDDLSAYYHASEIFVLPSIAKSEAFGIVQLEAQACGKPVISTNLPTGVPYANKDKETGIVVEPKSSKELAKAINLLLENEELRLEYGNNAKRRVNELFTVEKMGESYFKLYEEVLKNN
jgi:rhamnosyl/mannosyltransferase